MAGTIYSQFIAGCINCSAGSYSSAQGLTVCSECKPGTASSQDGATECLLCAAGTFASAAGQLACSQCPAGSFWADNASQPCAASGALITCPTDELTLPAYVAAADQTWTIAPPGARGLVVELVAADTAPGDLLTVYSCEDPYCLSSTQLAAFSGAGTGGGGGGRIVTGSPALRLHWVSAASAQARSGWRAQWVSLEGTPRPWMREIGPLHRPRRPPRCQLAKTPGSDDGWSDSDASICGAAPSGQFNSAAP